MTRVLIIDDNQIDRMIHRRWLEAFPEEFFVEEANTAESGIEAALRERFDCVLLDYVMPDGTGLHAVRVMRAAVPNCPPIILISCALTEYMKRNALALGVFACHPKPVTSGEALANVIREAVEAEKARIGAIISEGETT